MYQAYQPYQASYQSNNANYANYGNYANYQTHSQPQQQPSLNRSFSVPGYPAPNPYQRSYSYAPQAQPQQSFQAQQPQQQAQQQQHPQSAPQSRMKQVGNYIIYLDCKVGSGESSVVYRGINTQTQEEVSVKYVDCMALQPGQKNMVLREAHFLKQLNHPNILKCTDVLDSGSNLYIIGEYCSQGDLYNKLQKEGPMNQQVASQIMKGIANALCTLKTVSIIHRDIKPENVLLKDGIPKLADFGFAINQQQAREQTKVNIGSPIYMPPQVLFYNRYSFSSDVFAFGVMLYELIHGTTPWQSATQQQLKAKLYYNPQLNFKEGVSQSVKQLIACCLNMDPAKRPTIEQVYTCFS